MQEQQQNNPAQQKQRLPRLRLPFEKKAGDPGEWSYLHRAGICITLILYIVVAGLFVWGKVGYGHAVGEGVIYIEFPEEERDIQEPELQQVQDPFDFSQIANRMSNENAQLDSELRDDRGTNTDQLYNDAGQLDDQMKANREAYEAALRQEQEMINSARNGNSDATDRQDTKVAGMVTVSFSFTDPIRTSVNLVVPAYRCEGGGQVVVSATLDNNGNVVEASVVKSQSAPDDCMQTTAVAAARRSRFNLDTSAPSKHKGTITYVFIPQ